MGTSSSAVNRDAGETLPEVLVAVTILGIAISVLLGGIGASAVGSDVHRKQASAELALRAHAEAIQNATYQVDCTTARTTSYTATTLGIGAAYPGYAPTVMSVAAQPPGSCATLQLVTLQLVTTRTTLSVSLVKQAP